MRDQIIIAIAICLENTEYIKNSASVNNTQVYDIIHNDASIKASLTVLLLGRALSPYDIENILNNLEYCDRVATLININKKEKIQLYGPKDGNITQTTLY